MTKLCDSLVQARPFWDYGPPPFGQVSLVGEKGDITSSVDNLCDVQARTFWDYAPQVFLLGEKGDIISRVTKLCESLVQDRSFWDYPPPFLGEVSLLGEKVDITSGVKNFCDVQARTFWDCAPQYSFWEKRSTSYHVSRNCVIPFSRRAPFGTKRHPFWGSIPFGRNGRHHIKCPEIV